MSMITTLANAFASEIGRRLRDVPLSLIGVKAP
jgi:hypothetical protein